MLLLPIIPSLLGYIHGSSEDNFSEKWENGLLRHSMWPLANFLFLGSKSILMHTRFILVKLCRPTLIQKVWVCGLVVRGADLWGMYVPSEIADITAGGGVHEADNGVSLGFIQHSPRVQL